MVRIAAALAAGVVAFASPLHARVTRIVIDDTVSPAFCSRAAPSGQAEGAACQSFGAAGRYEQISGRAFGELDPKDPLNAIIQDIDLARDKDGKVRYVASFV